MENPIQCRPIENPFATSAGSTPLVMLLADTEVDVGATFRSRNLLSDTIVNIKIPETIAITSGFVSLSINDSGDASSERALVTQNSLTHPSSESSQVRRALIPLVTSIQTTVPTQSVIPPQTTAAPATISQPDLPYFGHIHHCRQSANRHSCPTSESSCSSVFSWYDSHDTHHSPPHTRRA